MNQSPLRPTSTSYVMQQPPRVVSSTTTTYGPTTTYPVTTYQSSPYVVRTGAAPGSGVVGGPLTTTPNYHHAAPILNVVSPDGVVVGAYGTRGAPAGAAGDVNSRPRRVVIKKQKAGCCGGCNRNGCCDKGSACGCWNCGGCCDRSKTTYRRMGSATSVVEVTHNNRRRC